MTRYLSGTVLPGVTILLQLKALWLKALKWVIAVAIAAAIAALVTTFIGDVLDGDNRSTSTEPRPEPLGGRRDQWGRGG